MKITIDIDDKQTAALERLNAEFQTEKQPSIEEFALAFLTSALNKNVSDCREKDIEAAVIKLRVASDADIAKLLGS